MVTEPDSRACDRAAGRRTSLLAWAGWQLTLPADWQPLQLSGTPEKGHVIVGGAGWAILRLQWERVREKSLPDGALWVAEQLRRRGLLPSDLPPAQDRFTACGWAVGVQTQEGREAAYWFGYAEPARLLLGITVNGALPADIREQVLHGVLPTLQTTPRSAACTWALYDISFRVPPGLDLARRRLVSGDVALEFVGKHGHTLLVRQVYPSDLALRRRSLEGWLEAYPFVEHRRLCRRTVRVEPWQAEGRPELTGIQRTAWKRFPSPLGAWAPRQSRALAVHDRALHRVLIAELMTRVDPDQDLCGAAIQGMNADLHAPVRPEPALSSCPHGTTLTSAPHARSVALRARPRPVPPVRQEEKDGKLYVTIRFQRPTWQRVLGAERIGERTFGFDPCGRRVYESCDGERSVEAIVARFAAAMGVSLPEAEMAVTRFLRTLVAKGLIVMEMDRHGAA